MNDRASQRICVAMDEVMADAVAEHLLRYNRGYGGNITEAILDSPTGEASLQAVAEVLDFDGCAAASPWRAPLLRAAGGGGFESNSAGTGGSQVWPYGLVILWPHPVR
jgi:hypothetical protein